MVGVLVSLFAGAPTAHAAIPTSLKATCSVRVPEVGYSYKLCDDGLPPVGGLTPNELGTAAVEVPGKYAATGGDDYTGLPPRAPDAAATPGADSEGNVALDVDIAVPTLPAPVGGYPLLVFMHGCCGGSKFDWRGTSFEGASKHQWHYNSAWFAARGYVVLNYTARGFVNGENNGNHGSTGEMHWDSRRFEMNDFQDLAGQIADDPFFNVNPQKVVVTGGSYGGAFAWMALTDPIWRSPGGKDMKLSAVAPKFGWTDLVDSLVPTGRHFQTPDSLPAFDGSDSLAPIGMPKTSTIAALYEIGKTGNPPGSPHTTFPPEIDDLYTCLNSSDPFEANPACQTAVQSTLPSFIADSSAYYQNDFFAKIATDPAYRIPVANAGTLTDPLFPAVETRRMANRLRATVPGYPIQEYYGDYQHYAQDKAKEWGDICGSNRHVCAFSDYPGGDVNATPNDLRRTGVNTRLSRFLDHYAAPPDNPSEPQPAFDVTASLQICPENASGQAADEPGPTSSASSFEGLSTTTLDVEMSGDQATSSNAEPNPHAATSDPLTNLLTNGGHCPVETTPAGPGVATYDSAPLQTSASMIGAATVAIDYTSTIAGIELNSRLYDVFPDGSAVMVDRGVYRAPGTGGTAVYQLHGNGWRFESGHKIRIEIAQDDDPYVKVSSVASSALLSHVSLEIPVRDVGLSGLGYPRPKGAALLGAPLVPAFRECTAANTAHGPPFARPSCQPPVPESGYLTVGTPDSNGKAANMTGYLRLDVILGSAAVPEDDADVLLRFDVTDVRSKADLSDYTGELEATVDLRMTDKLNGSFETAPATVEDVGFPVVVPCSATAETTIGARCSVSSTIDALVPGTVREGKRSVWDISGVEVFDGGPDGVASTGDNGLFLRRGIFIP
jgi:hypothetical protein